MSFMDGPFVSEKRILKTKKGVSYLRHSIHNRSCSGWVSMYMYGFEEVQLEPECKDKVKQYDGSDC